MSEAFILHSGQIHCQRSSHYLMLVNSSGLCNPWPVRRQRLFNDCSIENRESDWFSDISLFVDRQVSFIGSTKTFTLI